MMGVLTPNAAHGARREMGGSGQCGSGERCRKVRLGIVRGSAEWREAEQVR